MTAFQLDESAHAPCTRTMVGLLLSGMGAPIHERRLGGAACGEMRPMPDALVTIEPNRFRRQNLRRPDLGGDSRRGRCQAGAGPTAARLPWPVYESEDH